MALAHLCQEFRQHNSGKALGTFRFTAFIIDHKAREGGCMEVRRTKRRLKRMGLHLRDNDSCSTSTKSQ